MGVVLTSEQIDYINKKDRKRFDYCFIIPEYLAVNAIKTGFLSVERFKDSPWYIDKNMSVASMKILDDELIISGVNENKDSL